MKKILDEVFSVDEMAYDAILEDSPDGSGDDELRSAFNAARHSGDYELDVVKGWRIVGRGYGHFTNDDGQFTQGQVIVTAPVVSWRFEDGEMAMHSYVLTEDGNEYEIDDVLVCSRYCSSPCDVSKDALDAILTELSALL